MSHPRAPTAAPARASHQAQVRRRWASIVALTIASAGSSALAAPVVEPFPPAADDPAVDEQRARELFDRALRLEPGEPEAALETLRCADRLAPKPAIILRIGTIAERLGERELAADAFQAYLDRAGAQAPDAAQLRQRIAELRKPRGSGPDLEPAPEPAPVSAQEVAGWVLLASGLGLGIAGGVLLGVAKAGSDEVHDIAPGTTAWASDEASGRFEAAQTEQAVGIGGLVVGVALAALGAVLLGTLPAEPEVALRGLPAPGLAAAAFELRF